MDRIGTGLLIAVLLLGLQWPALAQQGDSPNRYKKIDEQTEEIFDQVVEWRRHFHQNPELSNREEETAEYIADYLRSLGIKVETGIAHTGVVGVLEGGKKGPVVGLRADIDALPV
jgi:amidohydrolase